MKARRLGHVYCPTGEWTHASTPTHQHLGGDYYRIYYGSRDAKNRTHVFSLDIDINRPTKPENIRGPLLSPGERGTFDDSGCSPACVAKVGDWTKLYYLGWNLSVTTPFRNAIGSSVIAPDGTLTSGELELDRSKHDPLSIAYPWVIGISMYYSSNLWWGESKEDMLFVLKTACTMDNGYTWQPEPRVLPISPGERAIVRPSICGLNMFYAVKRDSYSIGNAISEGGFIWHRRDDIEFSGEPSFDSEEQTYPCAFAHKDKIYMLYNGNGYGRTGFGIAVIE